MHGADGTYSGRAGGGSATCEDHRPGEGSRPAGRADGVSQPPSDVRGRTQCPLGSRLARIPRAWPDPGTRDPSRSRTPVIVYVDSSLVTRALLDDEPGHAEARELLAVHAITPVTGSWTRIEVTGAVVRAIRAGRLQRSADKSNLVDELLQPEGRILTVAASQTSVEAMALRLVRAHGLRAMDAWHLSVARLTLPVMADKGQTIAFASRDAEQAAVAADLGLTPI